MATNPALADFMIPAHLRKIVRFIPLDRAQRVPLRSVHQQRNESDFNEKQFFRFF